MDLKQKSTEIIKKYQAENGAYVACPNFPTYHYCWLRDGAFIAYGMDIAGEHRSSARFYEWCHKTILKHRNKAQTAMEKKRSGKNVTPQEQLHTRYTLEGEEGGEEWPNFQLDGYGTWLWGLSEHVKQTQNQRCIEDYADSIELTLHYIEAFWDSPNYDCWEEFGDKVHPATLACLYGGLIGINRYFQEERWKTLAEKIKTYTLTYGTVDQRLRKSFGSVSVDASLLWTALPFGLLQPSDPIMVETVKEIESKLLHDGGVHRYPEDTYYGGGLWVILSAWLGWYYAETEQWEKAKRQIRWIEAQQNTEGELPEQVNTDMNDPSYYQRWVDQWGEIATPLLWSHAMYLVLHHRLKNRQKAGKS